MRRRVHVGSGSVVITGRLGLVSGGGGRHQHLTRFFSDNELEPEATVKKCFIVQTEGSRQIERSVEHYDALITAETQMHEALKPHKKRPDAAAFPSLEEE